MVLNASFHEESRMTQSVIAKMNKKKKNLHSKVKQHLNGIRTTKMISFDHILVLFFGLQM